MDEEISRWILEFLVRQRVDDNVLDSILSKLPLRLDDSRLKKALLLRRIRAVVSNGVVSEKILDMLELVRKLDFSHGKVASESMKMAFCAVAVDCTVRFLDEEPKKSGDYYQAMKRIWKVRVRKTEKSEDAGLISEKLLSWRDDIKAAIRDREICDRILSRNTRNEALKAVKGYLVDAWNDFGPSFLEKTAGRVDSTERNEQRAKSERDGNVHQIMKNGVVYDDAKIARNGTSLGGDDGEERPNGEQNLPEDKAGDHEGSEDLENAGEDHGLKASAERVDGDDDGNKHGGEHKIQGGEEVLDNQKREQLSELGSVQRADLETQEVVEIAVRHKHVNLRGILKDPKRAKIADPRKTDEAISVGKTNSIPPPEVSQVKDGSVSKEPQRVTLNPLSDTLHTGLAATQNPSTKEAHVDNVEDTKGNKCVSECPGPPGLAPNPLSDTLHTGLAAMHNPSTKEAHVDNVEDTKGKNRVSECPGFEDEANPVKAESSPKRRRIDGQSTPLKEENNAKVAEGKMAESKCPDQGVKGNPVKPSLMERKPSARTYKWEELGGGSASGSSNQFQMPSPKRRIKRRWTSIEEETLREGVKKFGKGNWKLIQLAYREVFETRSEVDLKDKWRNLTR